MLNHLIGSRRQPDRAIAAALLLLRLFIGATFVYAGLDKLTDPAFFDPKAPTYIGQQMAGYVRTGSQLSWLLTNLAIPHATFFGALIALGELWVGLATLAGLLTRVAALGGLALSVTFCLTASWAIRPYFMGPDLPYAWVGSRSCSPAPARSALTRTASAQCAMRAQAGPNRTCACNAPGWQEGVYCRDDHL